MTNIRAYLRKLISGINPVPGLTVWQMPLFHSGALYGFIFYAIYWDTPVAFGIPDMILTSNLAMECLNHLDVEATVLPPSILEDMCHNEKCLSVLRKLKVVAFGGGRCHRRGRDDRST